MGIKRRHFIKSGLAAIGGGTLLANAAESKEKKAAQTALVGCLVDTTLCIGCRKCEEACNRRNKLPRPEQSFSEMTVLREPRRPDTKALTVVNQYAGSPSPDQPQALETYCKVQCMHCLKPACVSACIVGALLKGTDGSVVYKPEICLGCRYCLVACPFEIPAYEYDAVLKPKIVKCQFCAVLSEKTGANPACAAACPTEALVFGLREELLKLAEHRIQNRPDRYLDYIYGQYEVGGTSWLYLTGRPAEELQLLPLPKAAPPVLTESIQHGIYKYGALPLALYGALAGSMWYIRRVQHNKEIALPKQHEHSNPGSDKKGENP
jgi:formate dehydrogenase iron-sulfur subunit